MRPRHLERPAGSDGSGVIPMHSEILLAVLGGATGAAIVTGAVTLIQFFVNRADKNSGKENVQNKALRYIMLYIIEERAKQLIEHGSITLEKRRSIHHWHELYHDGLGGNGDADALMAQINKLPLDTED